MARMPMRGAPMRGSMARMPMQRGPMLNSAFGSHRFNDGDFDRDDRFRRFNRFNDFDRNDRFRRFNRFNDFDRDDRFRRFHHHNFNDIIVFDNFGFPFFPFYYPYPYYPYGYGYQSGYDPYGYGGGYGYQGGYGNGSSVVQVQQRLARAGYYHGAIDGIMGPATRRAIRAYERDHNMRAYGVIDGQRRTTISFV